MNLLLVDDHALLRDGLRSLLTSINPAAIVHEAGRLEDAIKECAVTRFQIVLLDLGLSTSRGVDTLIAFRRAVPDVAVVVLSGDQHPALIRATIAYGAVSFVPKSHSSDLMITALRCVLLGGVYLPPQMIAEGQCGPHAPSEVSGDVFACLTPYQCQLAKYLLQGISIGGISRALGLAESTVNLHVSEILQAIGAKSRFDAVMLAARNRVKFI
jgi:DNA-binding NarL/FixJ family response regulator